jgi:nicotinamidase-related amidase
MILALNLQVNYFDPSGLSYTGSWGRDVLPGIISYLSSVPTDQVIYVQGVRPIHSPFYVHQTTQSFVGAPETAMAPEIVKLIKTKVTATSPDATKGTTLLSLLKGKSIELLGAETQSSILFTAATLKSLGYDVSIRESLVSSRDKDLHGMGMTLLSSELGVSILS